jgi:ribosome biogenesis GTPase A
MLAASHAIGTNAVIEEEVATFLAGLLLERYPAALAARYGLKPETLDAVGVVEGVAKKRGCIRKGSGGEFDLEKASLVLLTDYRSGALGRISLESPQTRAAMLEKARTPVAVAEAAADAEAAEAAPDQPVSGD